MTLFSIVSKNLLRRPVRSLLTVAGITIGIAAVVALTSLVWGFERSWVDSYTARGTDLIVARLTSRDPVPTPFTEQVVDAAAGIEDVRAAAGVLNDLMSIEDAPTVLVVGWQHNTFVWDHLKLVKGRWPKDTSERVALLGEVAAEILSKGVGDTVHIETEKFVVCGVFSSQALSENGSVILPLNRLQALTERAGMINSVNLRLTPGLSAERVSRVRERLRARLPGFKVFDTSEMPQANIAIQAGKAMSLATSLIALLVGAVGVMNTVLMSVFERLHEIGVLLAIGWRRRRIVRMILLESLALSLIGGLVGIAVGIAALHALQMAPWFRGRVATDTRPLLLGIALAVSLALGMLGGVYPAWRGANMSPTEALRHE